jgi:hypothetical protein
MEVSLASLPGLALWGQSPLYPIYRRLIVSTFVVNTIEKRKISYPCQETNPGH